MIQYLADDMNPTGYLQVVDEVSDGAVQVRYTFGNVLVSQARSQSSTFVPSFYGYDAHGNITFLTDGTGAETNRYTYDAWGNVVATAGSVPNTRVYTGEEFDADLGLINLRARQYLPQTGRFWTIDPAMGTLRQPTTLNRYLYANGQPIDGLDPTGRVTALEYSFIATATVGAIVTVYPADNSTLFNYCGYGATLGGGGIGLWSAMGTTATIAETLVDPAVALTGVAVCALLDLVR